MAAETVAILTFETDSPVPYKAGQAFLININEKDVRPYSVANAPVNGKNTILEFHIGKGEGLSKTLVSETEIGECISMEGPAGDMTFKTICKKPILTIAGGTGLAQMKAICEAALLKDRENPVYLFHGARRQEELYLHDEMNDLAKNDSRFLYKAATSEEQSMDPSVAYGFVSDIALTGFDNLSGYRAYICGPEPMVNHARRLLLKKGIDEKRIHSENWTGIK